MNGCRSCGHEQASHHEHVGSCTARLCTCPTFEPADPLARAQGGAA